MKGDDALYRIKSYKKGNGIALAFTGKMLSDLGIDGPCELDVGVSDGAIVLKPVNKEATFPLRFGKWTFDSWEELAGFSANQARMAAVDTSGNGGDEPTSGSAAVDNSTLF